MRRTRRDSESGVDSRKGRLRKKLIYCALLMTSTAIGLMLFILLVTRNSSAKTSSVSVKRINYGTSFLGETVYKYMLQNGNGMEVHVITLGGIIDSILVPDRKGNLQDIILGFDDLQGYERKDNPYFGALIGRYANRIASGRFSIDGVPYNVTLNNFGNPPRHHLHGGTKGWDKVVWRSEQGDGSVTLWHESPDGDQGYPGKVCANVTLQLTDSNELIITYMATSQGKATPISLTSHPYFNLAGQGASDIYDHEVTIYANYYLEVGYDLIPTGRVLSVTGSLFDLRLSTKLGDVIPYVVFDNSTQRGFDHNFIIKGPTGKRLSARVVHPDSGRVMEVYTNQPGVQFYTGNFLNLTHAKQGHHYGQHSGFCLETQNYPDAVNHENFPDCVLYPGSTYVHQTWFKFSTI